ncbi:MAG: glycosyltransferase family 2 protein [Kiritimatiellae bacterium]|nr:glycosyltransferase family 2 protein [Kiritimatiellia bacterium]
MTPVSVVIPVYGREDALSTVPFLLGQPYADSLRVVVVDNGNAAALSARLKALESDRVDVVSFPENRGGSAAYIAGMQAVRRAHPECRFVWLLDDDAKPNADTLPALVRAMEGLLAGCPRTASVGSTVVSEADPGQIVECGASFSVLLGHAFPKLAGRRLSDVGSRTIGVCYAAACSLLVNVAAVEECGFWEDVFIHLDDIEWGLRVSKAGWRNFATTDSTVVHPEFDPEKAGPWVCYFDARNQYWLAAKHGMAAVLSAWAKNALKNAVDGCRARHRRRIAARRLAWRDFRAGVRRSRAQVEEALERHGR